MKSYCVKERKQTECIKPDGYQIAKNGRRMYWCTCATCGIKKYRFVANEGGTKATPKPKTTKPKTTKPKTKKPKTKKPKSGN